MSEPIVRKKLTFPPSYDIGHPFFYRNLLAGSDYVQAFIRENIALFDSKHEKVLATVNSGGSIESSERPKMAYESFLALLDDAGVGEKILEQFKPHISHMAGGIGKPLDYIRIREFLAFCGIDGIFDLEAKKHIHQARRVKRIPTSIVPERWRAAPDIEEIRQDIAFMMDNTGRFSELDAEIRALSTKVWGDFVIDVTKDVQNNPLPADLEPLRQEYLQKNPDRIPFNDELVRLQGLRESTLASLKDQYAPMDPSFKLPELGLEFDRDWFAAGEAIINQQRPFRRKFDKYMNGLGHKKGDPEYDSFDWQSIRSRSFAIWDWAYRNYTASPVNRGTLAEARRGDFNKGFVKAVKEELKDNLLSILNLPYKIEAVPGSLDQYAIVCNDCEVERFTLQQVYDLETQVIEEAEKASREASKKPSRKAAPAVVASPALPKKSTKTPRQKEEERLAREDRIRNSLIASGVDPAEIKVHGAPRKEYESAKNGDNHPEVAAVESHEGVMTANDQINAPQPPEEAAVESQERIQGPTTPGVDDVTVTPVSASPASPKAVEEEEDLLFPDAGVAGEGDLDHNGNRITPMATSVSQPAESAKVDDPVVNFGDVAPDRGLTAVEDPSITSDKPATPKGANEVVMPSAPSRSPKVTGSDTERKRSPFPERPRDQKPAAQDSRTQNPPYVGGRGMGGYGGGHGFNPQSVTVDLGLSHLVRGLAGFGRSVRESLRPPGPNVFEATESLNKSIGKISDSRLALDAGTDESGAPLTEAAKIAQWTALNSDLRELNGQVKTLEKVPRGAMDDDTLRSFKNAAKEITATRDLAKRDAKEPGRLGELALEAQKVAEQLAQVLMNIVKAVMSVFSRNKSPSL